MPRRDRSNTMARRYKGRPNTFRTDLVHVDDFLIAAKDLADINNAATFLQENLIDLGFCKNI